MIALLALAVGVLVHYDNDDYDFYDSVDEGDVKRASKMYVFPIHSTLQMLIFFQRWTNLDCPDFDMPHPHPHRNRLPRSKEPEAANLPDHEHHQICDLAGAICD